MIAPGWGAVASIELEDTDTFWADAGLGTGSMVTMTFNGETYHMQLTWTAWNRCKMRQVTYWRMIEEMEQVPSDGLRWQGWSGASGEQS